MFECKFSTSSDGLSILMLLIFKKCLLIRIANSPQFRAFECRITGTCSFSQVSVSSTIQHCETLVEIPTKVLLTLANKSCTFANTKQEKKYVFMDSFCVCISSSLSIFF